MAALTAELGRFVSELALSDVPREAQAVAKTGFTDCFGVMIAGAREPVVALVDRELSGADAAALASLIPSGVRRNVEDAALVNGVAAHVLDYDDVTLDGHPSAVLVPAILAQAEALGSSGSEMLAAYIAGYETWAELLVREPMPLHQKGWHPTAVRGTVAAAAACAKLRQLSPQQTATALAVAGSMAAGLVANFGTLTKCFQVGRAAQSGVIAARLAQAGMTAAADALEHRSGFLAAFSPAGAPDLSRTLDPRQKEWHLAHQGLNVKRYPVCYGAHRAIDAALELAIRHDIAASDVDGVHVSTGAMQMLMLRNDRPQTALEAKFSLQFAMASSLVARKVGLAQLTDDFVRSPPIQSLMPRVCATTTAETMAGSAFAPSEQVEITVHGKVLVSEPIMFAKGSKERPLSEHELQEKFSDCLGDDVGSVKKAKAFDKLMNLERLNSAADLLSP